MTLEDLQKKFETQAAVAELLKMLRPNGRELPPLALAQPLAPSRSPAGAGAAGQQASGLPQAQAQAQQAGGMPQQQQQQQQYDCLPNDRAVSMSHHRHRHLQPVRPPRPEPSQCLSVEKDWDKVCAGGAGGSRAGCHCRGNRGASVFSRLVMRGWFALTTWFRGFQHLVLHARCTPARRGSAACDADGFIISCRQRASWLGCDRL